MITYNEAKAYSEQNPDELVEFKECYSNKGGWLSGSFLNGKKEGMFEYFSNYMLKFRDVHNSGTQQTEQVHFRSNGMILKHFFSHRNLIHGEYINFNEDGTVNEHCFSKSGAYIEELDYLLDEDRDEAFYVTLALHGIDKEYTF